MKRGVFMALALAALAVQAEPRPFVAGSFQQVVAGPGPLIVRFWSLDCTYCMKEMPELKALAAKHPGWRLALVCTDDAQMAEEAAKALQRAGFAPDKSWIFADAHVQRLRHDVDPKWRGELPRTYLYRDGQRIAALSGALEAATIEKHFKEKR